MATKYWFLCKVLSIVCQISLVGNVARIIIYIYNEIENKPTQQQHIKIYEPLTFVYTYILWARELCYILFNFI